MPLSSPVRQAVVVATAAALAVGVAVSAEAADVVPPADPVPVADAPLVPSPLGERVSTPEPAASVLGEPFETVAPESELSSPDGSEIAASDSEALTYLLNCRPGLWADTPHISSDGSGQLSSHGTWTSGRCRDKRGTIAIHLQAYFSDHIWRSRGIMGFATVRPGGGGGKRATARVHCMAPKRVSWKAWAVIHTPSGGTASKYSNGTTLSCADG